jgi:TM2 domain-containing membrane protein YozV
MSLSTQEQILIEQRVTNEAKSMGLAYVIWFFLGGAGAHRFYLERTGSGIAMLVLFIIGLASGGALLIFSGIWALIDAFLIPGLIQEHKNETRKKLGMEVVIAAGGQLSAVDTRKWSKADRERLAAQATRERTP